MKKAVAGTALANGVLPDRFTDFVDKCLSKSLKLCAISIAGIAQDLKTKTGLLNLCRRHLDTLSETGALNNGQNMYKQVFGTDAKTSQKARLVGKVLLGKNVQLGQDIVIVGPAVICDNTKIGTAAVINSSIIGPDLSVPANQMLFNQVVQEKQPNWKNLARYNKHSYEQKVFDVLERRFKADNEFKTWPVISYARLMKPIADFIVSLIVLILFAPIVPFIILAIKINSPGPVFFKDKRQGKRGKEFFCLKFRTMIVGADKIQDKLRFVNQIDGPQFKMGDDPRISTVGRFLRNTCIDEIPQFFNVLMGQMSIVGPRPSPESENTMCPSWRYARLSVRPGITGLWQVCRTREPMKDFQEWIYYDTKYVQRLSLKTDLWVCWRTARHMAINFIKQF
ncbi:MAG: sugar transferase [Sedimentisphaerales bacterium]|nr:sugar transferase [Sedimentisphaerales bacterium]